MRKLIALLAIAALATSLTSTALAAKPKKVHDSFGASLAPFPKLAAVGDAVGLTKPGCTAGQEGVKSLASRGGVEGVQGSNSFFSGGECGTVFVDFHLGQRRFDRGRSNIRRDAFLSQGGHNPSS